MDAAVVLALSGIMGLLGAVFLFLGMRSVNAARASRAWPSVRGKVTSSQLMRGGSRSRPFYSAHVAYTFDVNGQSYSGDKVSFGNPRSNSSGKQQAIVDRYREGQEVEVFYNPAQPREAVLERRTSSSNTLFLILGPFLLILAMFVAVAGLMQ